MDTENPVPSHLQNTDCLPPKQLELVFTKSNNVL
jgi:hypothetical protein